MKTVQARRASVPKQAAAVKSRKLAASQPRIVPKKKRVAEKLAVRARAAANRVGRTRATAKKPKKKLSSKQRAKRSK
jgi:hypothetical protein